MILHNSSAAGLSPDSMTALLLPQYDGFHGKTFRTPLTFHGIYYYLVHYYHGTLYYAIAYYYGNTDAAYRLRGGNFV